MTIQKLAGLAGTALKSNFVTLKKPYKLNFAITFWCQSRCIHCNIWDIKPKGELTLDEVKEFAKKNPYFKWIELTGGEPFLRSDIVEIAKVFAENNDLYILTMPTNSLCNLDMVVSKITQMLELKIPRIAITVSLDGYRELHDKIRGVPGNFDRAIGLFKRLRELKKKYKNLYFVFGYTMINHNQGQFIKTLEGVKREIPDIKYNDFHINLGQISENYYHNEGNEIRANYDSVATEIEEVIKRREFEIGLIPIIEKVYLKKLAQYARTGVQPMKSRSLEASLFLDSWGNVFPSIMWNKKIANLRETEYNLNNIWYTKEAEEIRTIIKEGREPKQWTSCEAYQTLTGSVMSLLVDSS